MFRFQNLFNKKNQGKRLAATALALLTLVFMLTSGCQRQPETTGTQPGAIPEKYRLNKPPQLRPLSAEISGQRVPVIYPGMTVVVKARATDPDGDPVRYQWIVAPGSGTIDSQASPSVKWHVGEGEGLLLIAYDGRGGEARERINISKKEVIIFSGQVVSNAGKPIETAEVEVSGEITKTDAQGFFQLQAKRAKDERYVMNIRKSGFGPVSRIYDRGIQGVKWTMTQGTTVVVDPRQAIMVQDTSSRTNCLGSLSSRVDWSQYPEQRKPRFFDTNGQPIIRELPPELREALDILASRTECSPGISISIPANSLVDASGSPPTGSVEVTVSTVDLYTPDSMPGDMSVEMEGEAAYMQSFGAGTVSITASGKPFQLKKMSKAKITIPVDPTQFKVKAPIKPTIPFLRYDEKKGLWKILGTAKLNAQGDAYTAEVGHLSTFNTDLVKTNQACVKIDSSQITDTYSLEVIIPMGNGTAPVVRTFTISPDYSQEDANLHAIYNLPSDTWIMLIAIRENPPNNFVPLGTFVVPTGGPQNPSTPNRPEYNYFACQSQVALHEVLPKTSYIVNSSGRRFGPLPAHIYAMADQATGSDIYPLGNGAFYLFCLFDTGSTKVRIYNDLPYYFSNYPDPNGGLICNVPHRLTDGNWFGPDAGHLGLTSTETARLRLNGLSAVDPSTLNAPIGPAGSASAPQIELTGIEVQPQPSPSSLNVTLIGVPVIHQVVAKIDYTTYIERSGYEFYPGLTAAPPTPPGFQEFDKVYGPDITFYAPNDQQIPYTDFGLFLKLDRWGMPERYCLKNVTFKHGTAEISDQNLAGSKVLHYDTATTITIINDDIATHLGLTPGAGTFDCFDPGDGYVIDEVTMTGPNGTYTLQNVSICWNPGRIQSSGVVAAVIGSNFFDQVPVLFDGPRNRLGIGTPATNPVTWIVIPKNCSQ